MKAGKIILIILLLLVLVGGGVFAYLWFATDIFKSPKAMYDTYSESLKAEVNKFANKDAMDKFIDQIKKEEYTVKSNVDLSFKNGSKSVDFDDILEFEGSRDAAGENSQMKVTVNYSDKESFATDVVVNDKKLYGIFFDGVTTSYLGFNMDNLAAWMEELGADEETVNSMKDALEKADKYDVTYMLNKYEEYSKKYAELVKKNIPESAYAKSDDKEDKSITLTLSSEDLSKIFDAVGKELGKDIEKLADEMGEEVAEELDLSDFEESLQEAVEEIKDSNISLIYKLEKPEDGKNVLNITLKKDKQKINATVTVEEDKVTIDIMGMVEVVVTKKEQGKKVTYTANLQLTDAITSMVGSSADLDDYKFEIVETYDGLGTDSVTEEANITIQYGDYDFEVGLEGTVEFGKSDIEELTKNNTQFIDELSEEEVTQLFQALGKRLGEVNAEKIQKAKFAEKIQALTNVFNTSSLSGLENYDYEFEEDEEDDLDYDLDEDEEEDDDLVSVNTAEIENAAAYLNELYSNVH